MSTPSDLNLRMKVWTDSDGKRWLIATAVCRYHGGPMVASALRDAECRLVDMTAEEYNAIPYSYFAEVSRDAPSPGALKLTIVDLPGPAAPSTDS